MGDFQRLPSGENETEVYIPFDQLSEIQRSYIDWKALGGIVTDDKGPHKITLDQLGAMLNPDKPVLHQTLTGSCRRVPNFWDLVTERRKLFNGTTRLAYMHDRWYLKAATMDNWQLSEAWLINNDDNYKQKNAKTDDNPYESLLDALEAARDSHTEFIEAEVIDNPKTLSEPENADISDAIRVLDQ